MRTGAFIGMMLLGLTLMGVGGCSGFSSGDDSSDSGIAGPSEGGDSGSVDDFFAHADGYLTDGDIYLGWMWGASWEQGGCATLKLYNHGETAMEWHGIRIGLDQTIEDFFEWHSAGFPMTEGSELLILPTAGSYELPRYGTQDFVYCAEPAVSPVSFDIDAEFIDDEWGGWGDDDSPNGDDDDCDDWWNDCGDDDDDDCDSLLFGQLEYGNIRLAYMDAGYETNCGRCVRMQLYSTGTDDTYCNLEATVTATVGYQLTYAESLAWDHDEYSNVITLTGMWDDDLDEWDMWEGRICINPVNDSTPFDFIDLQITAQQGTPNNCS